MLKQVKAVGGKLSANKGVVAIAVAVGSVGSAMAQSSGPDTSAITTAAASVGVVGAAVFAVKVGVRSWKWFASTL